MLIHRHTINNFNNFYELFTTTHNYILPKTIYCYWNDYEENDLIKSFIENWKKKIQNWKIEVIHNNNLYNYVDNIFIEKYKNEPTFRFSDFLRLELLSKNGGCWMDISTLIINPKFLDIFYNEMLMYKYDVCVFELPSATIDASTPYLENWFIMAPKNSSYILDLYYEFNRAKEMDFIKYKQTVLIPSSVNLTKTIGYDYNNTYLMQHAIVLYLLKSGKKYNINIKNATEYMFKIHNMFNFDGPQIINFILTNNDWTNIDTIKLTSIDRHAIEHKNDFIKKIKLL